jgi:hypothetical protein
MVLGLVQPQGNDWSDLFLVDWIHRNTRQSYVANGDCRLSEKCMLTREYGNDSEAGDWEITWQHGVRGQ